MNLSIEIRALRDDVKALSERIEGVGDVCAKHMLQRCCRKPKAAPEGGLLLS